MNSQPDLIALTSSLSCLFRDVTVVTDVCGPRDFQWEQARYRGGSGGHGSDHGVHRRKRNVGTPRCEVVLRLGRCCRDILALLFGKNLSPRELAWLLYGYLGVFGFNLFALSSRMLFAERELLNIGAYPN